MKLRVNLRHLTNPKVVSVDQSSEIKCRTINPSKNRSNRFFIIFVEFFKQISLRNQSPNNHAINISPSFNVPPPINDPMLKSLNSKRLMMIGIQVFFENGDKKANNTVVSNTIRTTMSLKEENLKSSKKAAESSTLDMRNNPDIGFG